MAGIAAAGVLPGGGRAAERPPAYVFSKLLQFLDYDAMADAAAAMGFDGVDLTVRPGGHVEPERVAQDLPRAVAALRARGLRTDMMTTAVADAGDPVDSKVLETAAGLGVKFYRMAWFQERPGATPEEGVARLQDRMRDLSRLNRDLGLVGAYQNHAGTWVGASLWEVWLILRDADPAHLGVQYDIRHAHVEGATSWPAGLDLIHDRIKSLVFKDYSWDASTDPARIVNVPLGQGIVPFTDYLPRLKTLGVSAPVVLHAEYDLGGAQSGAREIAVPPERVFAALARDLKTLRGLLAG